MTNKFEKELAELLLMLSSFIREKSKEIEKEVEQEKRTKIRKHINLN